MTPLALYSAAVRALTPLLLARLLWRSRRAPAYRRRWRERLGYVPRLTGRPVWIHAVSVGETLAAAPLVQALRERHPDRSILITNTTPTGSERTRGLFGDDVAHCYLPWDTPGAVGQFLDRTQPCLGVLMETELWPNLLALAKARGVPLALVNARLSALSARGYARLPRLTASTLACLDAIATQTRADAEHFLDLGAIHSRVSVAGNIKFDQELPANAREVGRELRQALGAERPVWVAASTHDDEEAIALTAHEQVRERHDDAALILVPRHPERFDAVAELVRQRGHTLARRTAESPPDRQISVYLGDTMGELPGLLAAADVAFVGGSLVSTGGHNLLEPAALALPVLTGPHLFNFAEVSGLLHDAAALQIVGSAEALGEKVSALFDDAPRRQRLGATAAEVVTANRGARDRLLALLEEMLPGP